MVNTAGNIQIAKPREKKHSRLLFYLGMTLLLAVIFVRNVFGVGIPVLAILAIAAAIAVICDQDEMVALMAACIPLSTAFQYKYLIAICIFVYAVKFAKEIKITVTVLPLACMMIWELTHGFGYDFSFYEYFRNFSELIWCTLLMMSVRKKIDYPLIVRTLAFSALCMMAILLWNLLVEANFNFEAIFDGYYRLGRENADTTQTYRIDYNANVLGFIANLSISGLMQLIVAKRQRLWDYIMLILLFMFGVMTMSRTFLLCFALLLVLFVLAGEVSVTSKLKRILGTTALVLVLLFLVTKFMPTVVEQFLSRFQEDDITNGRSGLFAFYTEFIFAKPKHFLWGIGLQDFASKIDNYAGYHVGVCHNGTQELVVVWGLLGLLLFGWFLLEMVFGKKPETKRGLLHFIPLIFMLIYVQTGQLIRSGEVLLSLSFMYAGMRWNPEEKNELVEKN